MKNSFEFKQRLRTIILAITVVLGLSITLPAKAQDDSPAQRDAPRIMINENNKLSSLKITDAAGIIARAQERGTLLINVGQNVDVQPEGLLDAAGVAAQRANIASAQERVLNALGTLEHPENLRRYDSVPGLTMLATPNEIERLLTLPDITYIQEETVSFAI